MSNKDQFAGEKVSFNSKAVLLGLFVLVGFSLLVFTISLHIINPEQTGRLNTVFIAAVSGSLALGGTLITQLWGKNTPNGNKPAIISTTPDDTATEVGLDITPSASFNKLMDKSTINSKTFTLKDGVTNAAVNGTIALIGGNATLRPSDSLKPGTKHICTITKDVKDITNIALGADKVWSFTTAKDATVQPSK